MGHVGKLVRNLVSQSLFFAKFEKYCKPWKNLWTKLARHHKHVSRIQTIFQVFVEHAIQMKLGTRIELNIIIA
jgi:hypothetical protein